MPEPSTTVLATTTTIGITALSLFTQLDIPTLMGATAGASLFVTSAKNLSIPTRIIYLIISLFMGYQTGPAILIQYLPHPAVCAFIASACCIAIGLKLISSVEQLDLIKLINRK